MIDYKNSTKVEYIDDVRSQYPNCKVLITQVDLTDMENVKGIVYAISTSRDTYDLLCIEKGNLMQQGIMSMIIGSYGGFGVGIQYESKR